MSSAPALEKLCFGLIQYNTFAFNHSPGKVKILQEWYCDTLKPELLSGVFARTFRNIGLVAVIRGLKHDCRYDRACYVIEAWWSIIVH